MNEPENAEITRVASGNPGFLRLVEAEPHELAIDYVDVIEWPRDRITVVSIEGRFPDGTEFGFELRQHEVDVLIGALRRALKR